MYAKNRDLLAAVVVALIALALALAGPDSGLIRLIFGAPLVLVLPGYSLLATFARPKMGWAERLVLTIGLSIALTALGGLLLNLTAWGLQPESWAVYLASLTLVFSGLAFWRRTRRTTGGETDTAPGTATAGLTARPNFRLSTRQFGLFGLAAVLAVSSLFIARLGVENQNSHFTQFWMLPGQGSQVVKLGITSTEPVTLSYTVRLEVSNQVLQEWKSIELQPGKTWEQNAALPSLQSGQKVEAKLYRTDTPDQVYRWASLEP